MITRVHILAGFLGVGKTTAIRHLLSLRPAEERWAVLVNEFGEVGLDGALLSSEGGVRVKELAGGCICCTAGPMFQMTVVPLLRELRPHRLLIEPTGLAAPESLVDFFRGPGLASSTALAPVITLVDPAHWCDATRRENETYREQVDAADILLVNRADLCEPGLLERCLAEARACFPPKLQVARVEHGRLDASLLEVVRSADLKRLAPGEHTLAGEGVLSQVAHVHAPARGPHAPVEGRVQEGVRRVHHGDEVSVCGWVFSPERVFSAQALQRCMSGGLGEAGLLRIKGVFHSDAGWLSVNGTPAQMDVEASSHRRDSRVELLAEVRPLPDWDGVERQLRACLRSEGDR